MALSLRLLIGCTTSILLTVLTMLFSHGPLITSAKGQAEPNLPRARPLLTSPEAAEPTPAWSNSCERLPTECGIDLSEPEVISLTPDLWRTLVTINDQVNTTIEPLSDQEHRGV